MRPDDDPTLDEIEPEDADQPEPEIDGVPIEDDDSGDDTEDGED